MRNGRQERQREEESAPNDEVPHRVQQDAERRQGDGRFGRREQHQREERRAGCREKREPMRCEQRRDREDVEEDRQPRISALFEGELPVRVGRVEARLECRRQRQNERERNTAVTAREQAPGHGEQALASREQAPRRHCRRLGAGAPHAAPRSSLSPRRVRAPASAHRRVAARKTPLPRDAAGRSARTVGDMERRSRHRL